MTGNLTLLCNFVEKHLGTINFGNDQFAPMLHYGDLVQGNIMINRKSTCFIRDLQGNDLLTGNRGSDLYTISLQETTSSTPICLMAKASPTQACGTEFLNKTLNAFFKEEGIEHKTSTPRTPEQNGVVERRNRTLVEAARTMLLASKLPLFDEIKEMSETSVANDTSGLVLQRQKASDYDNPDPAP
ncbi:integrase, catalytic region, zinc finger, CCHC-type containing protein [Tanacetum coccineum]